MPCDQVAYKPSLFNWPGLWLFFTSGVSAGHDEEPFRYVRQHDVQHEEQDGGDAQKLCEFMHLII